MVQYTQHGYTISTLLPLLHFSLPQRRVIAGSSGARGLTAVHIGSLPCEVDLQCLWLVGVGHLWLS